MATIKYKLEKAVGAKDVELSALMQSVADKEQLLGKMSSLLEAANEAKQQHAEQICLYKESLIKLQRKLKASAAEITKGNQVISKLQADGQALRSQLRLKATMLQQQQQQAAQKGVSLHAADREVTELRAQMAQLGADKERADEGYHTAKGQLAEAQELLKSNQKVIQWLNKELNEAQSSSCRVHSLAATRISPTIFSTSMPATVATASTLSPPAGDGMLAGASVGGAASAIPSAGMPALRSRVGLAMDNSESGKPLCACEMGSVALA